MEILHEDSHILICYKEAGLAVQSARVGKKDLVSVLKSHLWEQGGRDGEPYLGIVHRLDQPVEGILVFAKTPQAAGRLSAQLTDGRMKKVYRAVVRMAGEELPEEGVLKDYLLKDGRTNCSRVAADGARGAKLASLEYRVLRRDRSGNALVEIFLHTGRHHQIRVQMAHAGMPLLGDQKYGLPGEEGFPALCSVQLAFVHPGTGKQVEFSCEPRGDSFRCLTSLSQGTDERRYGKWRERDAVQKGHKGAVGGWV